MRLSSTRILLVEDATDIREAFSLLLRAEGAEVVAAATGREALQCAASRDFDALLTDLGLPDIPGDVLIRQILATARRRPRVVVVTGYGEPYPSRARAAGADIVFTKPIEWSMLLRALRPLPRPLAA
jgi:two-component system KDP operon response regulator KdpE